MDMKQMPTFYKVGRLVLAIWSAVNLYLVFLMTAFLVCIVPQIAVYERRVAVYARGVAVYELGVAMQMAQGLVGVILVLGGMNSLGFYGAVYHHYKCLVAYAGIYFTVATLGLVGFFSSLPGVGVFLFCFINSSSTLIPAYMAYCIKNVDLFADSAENRA
ncbi:hypothetical protein HDE_08410 [Halotydeus destructor]|nr:hypothetical protein HDE_08410 [Halotydeus destructor]